MGLGFIIQGSGFGVQWGPGWTGKVDGVWS